jgi:hypothetical protein
MANITQQFPAYTGIALTRTLTPAEFNTAEEYFQSYHAGFVPIANLWAEQVNVVKDEINEQANFISGRVTVMSGYVATTKAYRDETLGYKNATQILHDDTVTLLENTDISGTAGYTIDAVDDMFTRQRNSQFVGLT